MRVIFLCLLTLFVGLTFAQEDQKAKRINTTAINEKKIELNTEIKFLDRESFLYQEFAEKVGILDDKLLILDDLKVYPNPNEGLFNLEFTEGTNALIKIYVYDFTGKILFEDELVSSNGIYTQEINIQNAPTGIYFLLIKQNDASQTRKIEKI